MNYIIANGICCRLHCCCKQVFETLSKLVSKVLFTKFIYFMIYTIFVFQILGVFLFLKNWPFFMEYLAQGIDCSQSTGFDCISVSLIYRITTSIVVFITLVLVIMSVCPSQVSDVLNENAHFSKLVVLNIIFVLSLQLDNWVFEMVAQSYKYVSYIFLICQSVIVVDLGYAWGIRWARNYSRNASFKSSCLLIGFTILMFLLAFSLNLAGYLQTQSANQRIPFEDETSRCSNLSNILNSIFIIVSFAIQLLNFNKQNSLLTTSFICIYISFLCFSSTHVSNKCCLEDSQSRERSTKKFQGSQFDYICGAISLFWGIASTLGSIFGSTNRVQDPNSNIQRQADYVQLSQNQNHVRQKDYSAGQQNQSSKQPQPGHSSIENNNWAIWHLFMLTMVINLSMILTDWGSGNLITQKYTQNNHSYRSKIFMASFVFAVYIWTLVAPRLFPNRNFYFT